MGNFAPDLRAFITQGGDPKKYALMTANIGGQVSFITADIHNNGGKDRAEFVQQSMQIPQGGQIQMSDDVKGIMDNIAYTTSILSGEAQQQ